MLRLSLCGAAALAVLTLTRGWSPPRDYRPDRVPTRDVIARTAFTQVDEQATRDARRRARGLAVAVYDHAPAPLENLSAGLQNGLSQLLGAATLDEVDRELWDAFTPPAAPGTPAPTEEEQRQLFDRFKEALTADGAMDRFKEGIDEVFAPLLRHGVLHALPTNHDANAESIAVRLLGTSGFEEVFPIGDVLTENVVAEVRRALAQKAPTPDVADRVFAWLRPRLEAFSTLTLNQEATRKAQEASTAAVEEQKRVFEPGDLLAKGGKPFTQEELVLLDLEHRQELSECNLADGLLRSLAVLGMYCALFTVGGFFVYRLDRTAVTDLNRFATLLATLVGTVGAMLLCYPNGWRAEVIPLLLLGMTLAVASRQDVALLLTAAITLVGAVAVGQDLADAVVLLATVTGAILALDSVRNRSKLLVVGFAAAVVSFFTALGVGMLGREPLLATLQLAVMLALWSVIAGSLMTCLLPLVERVFNVQTDLSLIELGDPAHPLLQELIRRAPGTYNHSITVASLAQSAAEAIGARGLLVRVGAYFHDIGKMLKPGYFIENQTLGENRHDALVPAMSTLVIIAHVKDGADLARQHHLPECIVDFIQQHHGTTLVEYFYRQAAKKKSDDPEAAVADERLFRYPGPKPQTKEAAVLMLADALESASRALVEPTPSRIENLVEEITRKRLEDGQFDECGLTLQELRKIGDSLVKSLTAVYHGRVKYPEQETA